MRRIAVVAGAVVAGLVLTPQIRAQAGPPYSGEAAENPAETAARQLARRLRHHGYWGFGRSRLRGGHLYLQAVRAPGTPVMVKMDVGTGRIVAVKRFARRYQRRGVGPTPADPLLAAAIGNGGLSRRG